jgi:MFS transporter, NNP family, nitrate/nitrite transporter
VILVGIFLMGGNGANFCIAPLIRKPLTGQIAGLIGAYGSVGSVAFMTILLLTNAMTFFLCMAATAVIGVLCCLLIVEPGKEPADGRPFSQSIAESDSIPLAAT